MEKKYEMGDLIKTLDVTGTTIRKYLKKVFPDIKPSPKYVLNENDFNFFVKFFIDEVKTKKFYNAGDIAKEIGRSYSCTRYHLGNFLPGIKMPYELNRQQVEEFKLWMAPRKVKEFRDDSRYYYVDEFLIDHDVRPTILHYSKRKDVKEVYYELKSFFPILRSEKQKADRLIERLEEIKKMVNCRSMQKMRKKFFKNYYVVSIFFENKYRQDIYVSNQCEIMKKVIVNISTNKKVDNNVFRKYIDNRITYRHPLDIKMPAERRAKHEKKVHGLQKQKRS
jgi:hypothetical protein